MKRLIKNQIKRLLYSRGHEMLWTRKDHVSGLQLSRDLPLLLPTAGAVCFDVGANTGQTLDLLQQILKQPTIHSFEPTPSVFTELSKTNWGAGVQLHNIALGSNPTTTVLNLYELPVLNSLLSLEMGKDSPFANVTNIGTANITVSTLDEFLTSHAVNVIDLLKIDTQGYDFEVLKGGKNAFEMNKIRHVLVELNYINLYEGQCSPWEIESFLGSHGFRLVDLYEKFRSDQAISWCTALFRKTT